MCAAARNKMFDEYLRKRVTSEATDFVPFEVVDDHDERMDGWLGEDGASMLLVGCGLHLRIGCAEEQPGAAPDP
jgi:hypothetical protein